MIGFVDESGTETNSAYLAVSLVLFKTEGELRSLRDGMRALRKELSLSADFEFHRSHNAPRTRLALEKMLNTANFTFYTFAIRKEKRKTSLNYERLAQRMVLEINRLDDEFDVKMDTNPTLHKKLHQAFKESRTSKVKISESESQKYDGLQVADYLVNISRHKIEKRYGKYKYQKLFNKCMGLYIINP